MLTFKSCALVEAEIADILMCFGQLVLLFLIMPAHFCRQTDRQTVSQVNKRT